MGSSTSSAIATNIVTTAIGVANDYVTYLAVNGLVTIKLLESSTSRANLQAAILTTITKTQQYNLPNDITTQTKLLTLLETLATVVAHTYTTNVATAKVVSATELQTTLTARAKVNTADITTNLTSVADSSYIITAQQAFDRYLYTVAFILILIVVIGSILQSSLINWLNVLIVTIVMVAIATYSCLI